MVLRELERVKMFRCVQDPMVGPKPRNAFMLPDLPGWEAWFHTIMGYVYVKTEHDRRHIIPTGNLSSVELYKESEIAPFKEEEHGAVQNIAGKGKKAHAAQRSGAV